MSIEIDRRMAFAGLTATGLVGCATSSGGGNGPPGAAGVRLRTIRANGVRLRIAEAGKGPLVILLHGFPESWYSWRHQLTAFADAGYHVVAPDLRGYGGSDKPKEVDAYDIHNLTSDVVGIIDAMGEKTAILAGHDWGSIVAWNSVLLHPSRFTGLMALSVPYGGRGASKPTDGMRRTYGENFYYILYFQEPGVAEKEFDPNVRAFLSRLYRSPSAPTAPPTVTDPRRVAGGWIPRLGAPTGPSAWISEAELDYFVQEFERSGFAGGINFYRNMDRNWETTPQLTGARINIPVMFIAGAQDTVIGGRNADQLTTQMKQVVNDLRGVTIIPNTGHWVQQERPNEVNAAMLAFMRGLKP